MVGGIGEALICFLEKKKMMMMMVVVAAAMMMNWFGLVWFV